MNNMIKISARVKDSYLIKRDKLITDIHNYIENNFDNILRNLKLMDY